MTGQLDLLAATLVHPCWFAARHSGHDQCATSPDGPCSQYPREQWLGHARPVGLVADSTWAVADLLRWGPACSVDLWNRTGTGRGAARVLDLTARHGYTILTRSCRRHAHRGNNVEYVLVGVPS